MKQAPYENVPWEIRYHPPVANSILFSYLVLLHKNNEYKQNDANR